jgi:GTPase SAR1 family protein
MSVQLKDEAVTTRFYSIASRVLSVETAGELTARRVESFFGGFYLEPSAAPVLREVDCTISVAVGAEPPPLPPSFHSFPMRHGAVYTDGEVYHLDVNESRVVVGSPASRSVEVWMGDSAVANHPVARVNVLSYAMHFALRRCGLADLHAAAVVEPESGAGALFVGGSNSGKSSLTIRLARAGWSYLSDDMLLLHETDEGIRARGLRRQFSVSASSLAGCDLPRLEEALGTSVASDPDKRRLEPSIVFPHARADSCRPQVIYFPTIMDESVTRIESLSRSEVLLRLLKLYPWACFDAAGRDYLRLLARLVRQARGYALLAGRDLIADASLAPRLLARHINS